MIELTIHRNHKDRTVVSFELSGHANAAEYGEDIVCAGVSAVAIGAVNSIATLCDTPLDVKTAGDEGGYIYAAIPSTWSGRTFEDGQLLLEGMVIALKDIEAAYGDFINVTEIVGGADKC
ncbi:MULTISPECIES: ribosomal-processing cysteine protease Prp [unclassified Geomicrobium]|uniref:ribosomal-processing cysteine protease Prp n=1 Tax=unclassified Geomicrobium TaxID=2628951 RepID=UPI00045ECFD6|nr:MULTISPECIES: ribosomal-processing cysteine protease Prp [unclassified Geomicrobium]GAJ99229.1 potential ribosomal protein [Geomicrobium sp. JCM 19055]GAK09289.1 potential ribosomal protein [Geomicrobium sp. JCM 19038]